MIGERTPLDIATSDGAILAPIGREGIPPSAQILGGCGIMNTKMQRHRYSVSTTNLASLMLKFAGLAILGLSQDALAQTTTPTVRLTGSVEFVVKGAPVTFTATVTGTGGVVPTGTVKFACGADMLGTAPLSGSGVASLTTGAFGYGGHGIIATYEGDSNYSAAVSNVFDIRDDGSAAPTVDLATSLSAIPYEGTAVLTATISGGFGTPTGDVYFHDSAAPGNTIEAALNGSGVATFSFGGYINGVHTFSLVYSGDDTYAPATSAGVNVLVGKPTISFAVTSGGSPVSSVSSGSVVTLTATVANGTFPVTRGLVNFCVATAAYCTDIHRLAAVELTSNGTATFKFRPGTGSHSYKAVFVGTYTNLANISSTEALTVTGLYPSITTIAQSGSTGNYTLTGTVGGNGPAAPTGTVSFLDTSNGNASIGSASLGTGTNGLSFLNASNPATGITPNSVVVADFNGDGIPDLAVTNLRSNTVTVLLGDGTGNFNPVATPPQTGNLPEALAVGDFNGDGNLDLVVVTLNDVAEIFLGDGNGTFTAGQTISLSSEAPSFSPGAEGVVVADFNGDGILDIAVANVNNYPNAVTVLLGQGNGTFEPGWTSPSAMNLAQAFGIAVGDFNGDGLPDLAVSVETGTQNTKEVAILLSRGNGTFELARNIPSFVTFPSAVTVADFRGIGRADLAVITQSDNSVEILLSNGDGTFTSGSPITTNVPAGLAVGDFNGDGIPDLGVSNGVENTVTVLVGNGSGAFAAATSPATGSAPNSVAVGDFNGDGFLDLAVANEGSSTTTDGTASILLASEWSATASKSGVSVSSGTHLVDASYGGDVNYYGSISGTTPIN
jgi:hypothetical protein